MCSVRSISPTRPQLRTSQPPDLDPLNRAEVRVVVVLHQGIQ
jgi:hypothetical protein